MYTFEDDHETSSRYKRSLYNAANPSGQVPLDDDQFRTVPDDHNDHNIATLPAGSIDIPGTQIESGPPAHTPRAARAALIIACIGVFLTAMDQTVVVTALPQVITDLHIPLTQLDHAAWIISAYLLGFVVAMPLMGRVSDIYGRRRIFLLCLIIFGVGSILCGIAPILGQRFPLTFLAPLHIDTSSPGLIWLISARVMQAIGGGAVVPVAMAIASDVYSLKKRALALGIIGAVTEAGGAIGPLYGALVVEHWGWQYIFYLNVPLVAALFIAACFFIPKGTRLHEGIDWLGAIFLALALTCLSLGLAQQGTSLGPAAANTSTPQNNPLALVLAFVFLLAFILTERKVRWPVIDLQLFKRFTFSASALVSLLVGAALIIAMADIPIYVDTVLQGSVLDSGLALLRLTVMIPIGALLGGWLSSRISSRLTAIIGLLFTAAGFYLMSHWPQQVDWTQMTVATLTAGFGFGLVIAPIGTSAINAVRATQIGMSTAIITALRMIGMILGLAALTSWALAYFQELLIAYPKSSQASSGNPLAGYANYAIQSAHTVYCTVFFITAILSLIAIVPALFLSGRAAPVLDAGVDIHDLPTAPIARIATQTMIADTASAAQRRKITTLILATLLIISGSMATYLIGSDLTTKQTDAAGTANAPRTIELSLSKAALTSVFATQLGKQQTVIKNLSVTPVAHDGLTINFNVPIQFGAIQRTLPVELDSTMYLDKQQNMQLNIQHFKRDGIDAGTTNAKSMQVALNQMLTTVVMPSIHQQLKGVKIVGVQTSKSIVCGKGAETFVLQIQATNIDGVAAQSLPSPICFNDTLDLNNLIPK
jgi:MFS family permease